MGSEHNTTPSSDWLTPLSHWLIYVEASILAEDTTIRVSRSTVVTCEVKSTDISPPTVDTGFKGVAPPFIGLWGVSFPVALRALHNPFPTSLVPAAIALLWEGAVLLHEVVATTGVTGATLVKVSASGGGIGHGGVGGCVHVVGRSDEGVFGNGG